MFRLTVFFSLSFNGSTSLKAIMRQITENVSEFIYFAITRKKHYLFTKWNCQGQLFSDIKAEFTSADTR